MSGGSPATPPPPCTPTCCSEARSPYSPSWISPPPRSWTAWANLLALGVVTNYGAYLAYGRSLQSINQVKAAIIGNIEPVLATFWVWLFWNENFSAYGWAGSALVISAVFLLTADRKLIRFFPVTAHGMFFGHAVFFASSRNTFFKNIFMISMQYDIYIYHIPLNKQTTSFLLNQIGMQTFRHCKS